MGKTIDLLGKIFGELEVISKSNKRDRSGRVCWVCKCSCGQEKIISSKNLISGDTKSCGSGHYLSESKVKRWGDITKNHWNQIKEGARRRDIKFDLLPEEAWDLFIKQNGRCALSGNQISFPPLVKSRILPNRGRSCTASLDRIDSSKGYTSGNIQWVHKDINIAKNTLEQEEFITMCYDVSRWNKVKDKIICLSGGADPIHSGHLKMISGAAELGKVVWILNSDAWLKRKKGYVFMTWEERAELIRGLKNIYDVVPVDDSDGTVCEALKSLKPDYFGNGGDRTDNNTPEKILCEGLDIELVWELGGGKIQSSSELVQNAIEQLKESNK